MFQSSRTMETFYHILNLIFFSNKTLYLLLLFECLVILVSIVLQVGNTRRYFKALRKNKLTYKSYPERGRHLYSGYKRRRRRKINKETRNKSRVCIRPALCHVPGASTMTLATHQTDASIWREIKESNYTSNNEAITSAHGQASIFLALNVKMSIIRCIKIIIGLWRVFHAECTFLVARINFARATRTVSGSMRYFSVLFLSQQKAQERQEDEAPNK